MSVIAFTNLKSSPGTTTSVLALAHVWPAGKDVLIVEADPAGGDIAARSGIASDPGLSSLAAAGRRAIAAELLQEHVQQVGGIPVLLGPTHAAASVAALTVAAGSLANALPELQADVLVDCGRLDPFSSAAPLIDSADLVVIVARPTVGELPRVAAIVRELGHITPCLLLAEGSGSDRAQYPAAEVAQAIGSDVLGLMPFDPYAASALWGGAANPKALERSALVRAARGVASAILHKLEPQQIAAHSWTGQEMSLPLLRRVGQQVRR